jgi:hypothetical protein
MYGLVSFMNHIPYSSLSTIEQPRTQTGDLDNQTAKLVSGLVLKQMSLDPISGFGMTWTVARLINLFVKFTKVI